MEINELVTWLLLETSKERNTQLTLLSVTKHALKILWCGLRKIFKVRDTLVHIILETKKISRK